MEPRGYLTENGILIFEEILDFLNENEISHEIDSLELTMLANAFDLHQRAAKSMNTVSDGYCQTTKNGYSQITAEFTVWQKTGDYINKHADKFGLNPSARDKIKAFSQGEEEEAEDEF